MRMPRLGMRRARWSLLGSLDQTLGNFRRTTNNDLNSHAGITEHGDQRVNTESVDLPPDEVADSGLRHAEERCRLRLGQAAGLNQLAQANHEIRSDLEVRGCLWRKSEVSKHVAARTSNLRGHWASRFWARRRIRSAR